jgi:D-alanyl-lipoteichoic acid acyltransferase DltB (MBOAT superfamily)
MYFKPEYILIIFFTIVVDYIAGLLIEKTSGAKRKLFLMLSIVVNVGVLVFYKYFNFFAKNFDLLLGYAHAPKIPFVDFILPIGLSFHTFQAMSYTIEVYRGNQKAEKHFGIYALYVMFYPQMVAGPIERPQHILPQLHRKISFSSRNLNTGIFLMIVGLFKKMVIADRLGLYVDPVFSNPNAHSSLDLLLATYFFAFQIYCDFSGYSDIAVGAALTLGIELMRNFNMPYISQNVSEFWHRWHISLSTWFRDYVYIPLGGSHVAFPKTCRNLLIVFLVSGLWHGANWKYLIWGLIHGILIILYLILKKNKLLPGRYAFINWLVTFNLICLAWIFFRAETVADAYSILERILAVKNMSYTAGALMNGREIVFCIATIGALITGERYLRDFKDFSIIKRTSLAATLLVICYFFGIFNEAQFIYFQF